MFFNKPKNGVKTPTVLQYAETECGLAALSILFNYHKVGIGLQTLREQAGVSRDGCRASTLISLAKQAGFEAVAYSLDTDAVRALTEPVIAYWRFSHYVVIEGFSESEVFINDPACGRVRVSFDEFDRAFTGIVIQLTPTHHHPVNEDKPTTSLAKMLLTAAWREQGMIVLGLVLAGFLPLIISGLNAVFVNHMLLQHQLSWLRYLMALMAGTSLLLALLSVANQWVQFKLSMKLSLIAVGNVFSRALLWPILTYTLRPISELLSVLTQVEASTTAMLSAFNMMAANAIAAVIVLAALFMMNTFLSIYVLILVAVSLFIVMLLGVAKKPLEVVARHAEVQWFAGSMSAFNHLETVALTGTAASVQAEWLSLLRVKCQTQFKRHALLAAHTALTQAYQAFALPVVMLLGIHVVMTGKMSLGLLLAYSSLMVLFNRQVSAFMDAVKASQTAVSQFDRSLDVAALPLDERFLLPESSERISMPPRIAVQNVTFYYNKTALPVVKNVNLTILPYQHIAFVGGTGSGKSTLANVLAGLISPDEGDVFLDDRALSQIHPHDIAKHIAMVSQEAPLYTGSLLDNLTNFREDISMEKVHEAVKLACLSDFLSDRGFEVPLDPRLRSVSGGEKQRIDIARALLQDTPILILDEASAALDIATEATLIKNLRSLKKTFIFIAHRLSTVAHCDQIYVMHEGEIIESGTHSSLLSRKGRYYDLVQLEATQND